MKPNDLPGSLRYRVGDTARRSEADTAPDDAWRALHAAACEPYRRAAGWRAGPGAHWAWHWARGKLARDPVFRALIERGEIPPHSRVLDIGGGQGLIGALLHGCAGVAGRGAWPAAWSEPPLHCRYTCIELMARDVRRGRAALAGAPGVEFIAADLRQAALPASDVVVILDVLHYVDREAQADLLRRVRDALVVAPRGGRLLLRVADAAQRRGHAASRWVDRAVTAVRGYRVVDSTGRSLAQWVALLQGLGFTVRQAPMSQGTPYANWLLVADLRVADLPAAAR